MLDKQMKLNFSPYYRLYELIIPKDSLLKRIHDTVDFGFIEKELTKKYCLDNGRMACPPLVLFKLLLIKCFFPQSDEILIKNAQCNMEYKYFIDLNPEDDLPHPSLLTKFRKQRLQDEGLVDKLINETVKIALDMGLIKSHSVIMDATHTKSRFNKYKITELLRKYSKELRKTVYRFDESMIEKMPEKATEDTVQAEAEYCRKLIGVMESRQDLCEAPLIYEKLSMLKEITQDTEEELYISQDMDAKTGYKNTDNSFFGYKTHIAMTPDRIITAVTFTSGEAADGKELPTLVEKSRKAGIDVQDVIADAAYSGKENIELANQKDENGEKNFNLVSKLNPVITKGNRKDEDKFIYNKDADMMQCPAGHLSYRKEKRLGDKESKNDAIRYYFDIDKCKECPMRDGCYKEGAKSKSYQVTLKCNEHIQQEEYQNSEEFKEKAKQRYKIEAKNNEYKNNHGCDRAFGTGMSSMKIQGACTLFMINLKRIFTLKDNKNEEKSA